MISGTECACLLTAILPLFIEAGKAYANGVDTLMNVFDGSRRDEALEEFYGDFHEHVVEINVHISSICFSISQTTKGGSFPTPAEILTKWRKDPSIEKALQAYFGSDARFNWFTRIASKIIQLLGSLIKDNELRLSVKDVGEAQMFQRLEYFASGGFSDMPKTCLNDRIRFISRKKDRDRFLRRLRDCTNKLATLISRVESEAPSIQPRSSRPSGFVDSPAQSAAPAQLVAPAQSATASSLKTRSLISNLYNALTKCWSCNCKAEHKIRLRLGDADYLHDETTVALDLLISVQSTDTSCQWQEASVLITSKRKPISYIRKQSGKPCEFSLPDVGKVSLSFIVEDIDGHPTMWQLPSRPCTLQISEIEHPSSLHELLNGPGKMSPSEKVKLAITLSYSLLLLHDSDWLARGLKKEDIFFYYKDEDQPDYTNPYLSPRCTGIEEFLNREEGNGALAPPDGGILGLGILLLEIFEEKPIEIWRTRKDKQRLHAFTDRDVAKRIVGKMIDSPLRSVVQACFDLMREVTGEIKLERQEVRLELFKRVIAPLEALMEISEVNWTQWA